MTQNSKQRFLAADELLSFRNHHTHGNKNTEKARISAGKRFLKSGIPMSKDEYWKFSSPDQFTSKELQNQLSFSDSNQAVIQSDNEINIFFVDGILDENLSDLQVNENLEIFSMNDNKATELLWVQELYGEVEAASQKRTKRALSAFNTACAEHGLFVRAKRGGKHKLVVNYIGKESDSDSLIHHLIKLEHDSNLVLIEKGEGASRLNRLIEIELLSSSVLDHIRFFGKHSLAEAFSQVFIRQSSESHYREFTLALNNNFIRNEFYVSLEGENAKTSLAGASLGNSDNVQDDTIYIAHLMPTCESRQVFKKVLRDNATGIFQGKIFVSSEAQKTDGYQISKGLLIGDKSKFLTKPELEIYADDVICSHGSTCGAIDDESLFYLTSRGVSKKEAVGMLILAFLDEAVQEIEDKEMADEIREILRLDLEGGLE